MVRLLELTLLAGLVVVGGCGVSVLPAFESADAVSDPRIIGTWFDSTSRHMATVTSDTSDGPAVYAATYVGDNNEVSHFQAILGVLDGMTVLDFSPGDGDFGDLPGMIRSHLQAMHSFSVLDIQADRIIVRPLDLDTMGTYLSRHPGAVAHFSRGEGPVLLIDSVRNIQRFLTAFLRYPTALGKPATFWRLAHATCEDLPADRIGVPANNIGQGNARFTVASLGEGRVRIGRRGGLPAFDSLAANLMRPAYAAESNRWVGVLSPQMPLAILPGHEGERVEARLERDSTGAPVVSFASCADWLPSSRDATSRLPAPIPAGLAANPIAFSWRPVGAAAMYEFALANCAPRCVWGPPRMTRDTTLRRVPTSAITQWHVRAYAPGLGFGPFSEVQRLGP